MKINFRAIKPPERKIFKHDIVVGDQTHTITLMESNLTQFFAIKERVNELKKQYEVTPLIDSSGKPIRIRDELLNYAVTIRMCQVLETKEDVADIDKFKTENAYTDEEILLMAAEVPDQFSSLLDHMLGEFVFSKDKKDKKDKNEQEGDPKVNFTETSVTQE
jgi:hypothetical protein